MKAIGKIWNGTSLIVKILVGLVLGALLGLLVPQATFLTILGDLFVGALKGIAPLLVFVLVISSLANATGGIGKRFGERVKHPGINRIALFRSADRKTQDAEFLVGQNRHG